MKVTNNTRLTAIWLDLEFSVTASLSHGKQAAMDGNTDAIARHLEHISRALFTAATNYKLEAEKS